jgi:hypothetical protein
MLKLLLASLLVAFSMALLVSPARSVAASEYVRGDPNMQLLAAFEANDFAFKAAYVQIADEGYATQHVAITVNTTKTELKYAVMYNGVRFATVYIDKHGLGKVAMTSTAKLGQPTSIPFMKPGGVITIGPGKALLIKTN